MLAITNFCIEVNLSWWITPTDSCSAAEFFNLTNTNFEQVLLGRRCNCCHAVSFHSHHRDRLFSLLGAGDIAIFGVSIWETANNFRAFRWVGDTPAIVPLPFSVIFRMGCSHLLGGTIVNALLSPRFLLETGCFLSKLAIVLLCIELYYVSPAATSKRLG